MGLPPKREIVHGIDLDPGDSLPNLGLYYRFMMHNEEIKRQILELLEMGHIKLVLLLAVHQYCGCQRRVILGTCVLTTDPSTKSW